MTDEQPEQPKRRGRPPRVQPEPEPVVQAQPEPLWQPAHDDRKAEDWQSEPKDLPWQHVRCRECNTPMYVRQPHLHDLCEECGWMLREQIQQMHKQQRVQATNRFVNPFMGSDMWGQTGSLPSEKK